MTKIKDTKKLVDEILQPIIDHCANNRGAINEVLKLYNHGLTKKKNISSLYKNLMQDASKRKIPAADVFMRLCEVWIEMRGKEVINRKEASIFCVVNGHEPCHGGLSCKRCSAAL